jgi:hypothetical protein
MGLRSIHENPGRIAQRESVPFTRERSKVRSLVRPPEPSMKEIRFSSKCGESWLADNRHLHQALTPDIAKRRRESFQRRR